jgi:ABC-type nitrate/sulfonate/bicarbonate transport system permease component
VVLVALWWLLTLALDRPRVYPPPDLILEELITIAQGKGETGSTYTHVAATAFRLVMAFAVSMVLGSVLGILAGRLRLVFSFVENLVWVFLAVPSIVWVFIFVVAIRISDVVPIAAIAAILTPMVVIVVAEGAKSIPGDILEMARSYHVTAWQRLTGIFLPYLVPYLASSSRTAFATGVKLVVVVEVVGLASGVGYEIDYWYGRLFMGPIVAWGVIMVTIGLLVDAGIFGPLERRVSAWKIGRPADVTIRRVA